MAVFCADVGSIKQGRFGWARAEVAAGEFERHSGGTEILELADALAQDLAARVPVTLGFGDTSECSAAQYGVQTYRLPGGSPTLSNDVAFLILVP